MSHAIFPIQQILTSRSFHFWITGTLATDGQTDRQTDGRRRKM